MGCGEPAAGRVVPPAACGRLAGGERSATVHVLPLATPTDEAFASLLIHQGESVVYAKEQLGLASIQIMIDVDGHLVPGGDRAAVDRLDDRNHLQPPPNQNRLRWERVRR